MSHNIYLVEYAGMLRNHHAIFVKTHESGNETAHDFRVTGDIQSGMVFENKPAKRPEDSASYVGKTLGGRVTIDNYPHILEIYEDTPSPRKQSQGATLLVSQLPSIGSPNGLLQASIEYYLSR